MRPTERARLTAQLANHRLSIAPKHTVVSLLGPRCKCCGSQIILATGGLIDGKYCGPCKTALTAPDEAA